MSAHDAAETIDDRVDDSRRAALASHVRSVAYASLERALELAPRSADLWCELGWTRYADRSLGAHGALECFERAIVEDPSHAGSLLLRAHCLQDLERWREAALAYDAVPPAHLVGESAWRYEHLLEQRAWCWLCAGERTRALVELDALLARWERDPSLTREAWGAHVMAAADGPLRDEIGERVRTLAERVVKDERAGLHRAWPGLTLTARARDR